MALTRFLSLFAFFSLLLASGAVATAAAHSTRRRHDSFGLATRVKADKAGALSKKHRSPRRAHLGSGIGDSASLSSSPNQASPNPSSELLFNGSKISDFALLQEAPGAITEVPDPLGSGETVFQMTVNNKDVAPITPTDNPRAQALSPSMIKPNEEFWLQTKFMLPQDMPSIPGWMSLVAIYGAPFDGSGPWGVAITENEFRFQRNSTYNWDIPWRAPLIKGAWVTVTLHEKFGSDGFVEMWIDGHQINFFPKGNYNPNHEAETEHLSMQTMDASNDEGLNAAKIMQYREANMFETGTVYFGALKLGTSRASVES